jgi:hypothetical protein
MSYTQVKNLQWANAEHTVINCEVNFDSQAQEFVPFTAVASGDYEYTHQIYAECVAGEYGNIAEYVAPAPNPEIVAKEQAKASALAKLSALGLTQDEIKAIVT